MPFEYKKALIVGATSGIGRALAEKMLSHGVQVIISGRRQDRLDELVAKYGKERVSPIQFDITRLDLIPKFATDIAVAHPDLDFVLLNSGIQRSFNFAIPDSVNLDVIDQEITTNYISYVHMTKAFVPLLQKHAAATTTTTTIASSPAPAALVYVSSGLALVPATRCLNYSATKAALHHFALCAREQLRESGVRIIEIVPPAVQTELHDVINQPDLKSLDGYRRLGMPLDEFTKDAWDGLVRGEEQVVVGDMPKKAAATWEKQRQETFQTMTKVMAAMSNSQSKA